MHAFFFLFYLPFTLQDSVSFLMPVFNPFPLPSSPRFSFTFIFAFSYTVIFLRLFLPPLISYLSIIRISWLLFSPPRRIFTNLRPCLIRSLLCCFLRCLFYFLPPSLLSTATHFRLCLLDCLFPLLIFILDFSFALLAYLPAFLPFSMPSTLSS